MTAYPHRMRLRGPWECDLVAGTVTLADGRHEPQQGPLTPPLRLTMPCRFRAAGLAGFAGRARFRRRFGYPGQIDSYERVWLTFAGMTAVAEVWLNGQFLGRHLEAEGPFEHAVTGLLRSRNELVVEVAAPGDDGGLWGEVALEVRRTAFLRRLRAWLVSREQGPQLDVSGEVAGTSERPLELYILCDGHTVAYGHVEAAPEGRPFHLVADPGPGQPSLPEIARVDLVDGAVLWYAAEVPVGGAIPTPTRSP
jgi:hypothetical protein